MISNYCGQFNNKMQYFLLVYHMMIKKKNIQRVSKHMRKGLKIISQSPERSLQVFASHPKWIKQTGEPIEKRELLVKTHGASGAGEQSDSLHGKPPKRKF